MSLINKMLQDLDKRHATGTGGKKTVTEQLRPVAVRRDWRRIAWEVGAGLVIGVGWTGWVMYQIAPRSVVTDLVLQLQAKKPPFTVRPPMPVAAQASPAPAVEPAAVPVANPAAAPAGATAAAPSPPPPVAATAPAPQSPSVAPMAPAAKGTHAAGTDGLKFATEIATPIKQRSSAARPGAESKPAGAAAPAQRVAAAAEAVPGAARAHNAPGKISIDMHASTPVERADNEFRKATALLNQGRVAEALDGYKATLQADARHGPARQALVGLLLENRRIDEAQQYLQEGLSLNPDRFGYAMLLARIQVERGDLQGAHDLLHKYADRAAGDGEYHAFDAALLQRLGRHKEAVAGYQAALKLAPQAGRWWMGMGISLQAENRTAEALDAFRRARSVGGLSPDLLAFVDQRLKQLQ